MRRFTLFIGAVCIAVLGCVANPDERQSTAAPNPGEKKTDQPAGETKKVELGKQKNIILEIQGDKREMIRAELAKGGITCKG